MQALCSSVLRSHPSLTRLHLRKTGLDDEGAGALAEALAANTVLQHLDLSLNDDLGDAGVITLLKVGVDTQCGWVGGRVWGVGHVTSVQPAHPCLVCFASAYPACPTRHPRPPSSPTFPPLSRLTTATALNPGSPIPDVNPRP